MAIDLIQQYPHPQRKMSARGAKRTHFIEKLDFACFDVISTNESYRQERDNLRHRRHVWDEPLLTHKEIVTHMQTIDPDWLDLLVAKTAFLCLEELTLSNATAQFGSNSSAFETTRYTYREPSNMTIDNFFTPSVNVQRVRTYLKYHITAILGHQIILTADTTPSNVHDSTMLPAMFEKIKKFGFDLWTHIYCRPRL